MTAIAILAAITATLIICTLGVMAWAESDKRRQPIPIPEFNRSQLIYIRANDYEFIPATMADLQPGDTFVMPDFYESMKRMEAAAADHAFWAAIADEDDGEIDDFYTDIGGESGD